MKRNLITFVFSLLATMLSAQKYHDAAAFDLRGNVKECMVKQSNETEPGYYRFTSDGALYYHWHEEISDKSKLHRDADGDLSRLYLKGMGYEYAYDDAHRILATKCCIWVGVEDGISLFCFYKYNEKGYIATETTGTLSNEGDSYEYTRYDAHGNWTERKVFDLKTKEYKYKETRTITYWDDAKKQSTNSTKYSNWKRSYNGTKFPLKNAKEVSLRQLILHPFGITTLSHTATADELLAACTKNKWNAYSVIVTYNGRNFGTVKLTETKPGDFKNVFGYKYKNADIMAEAGFVSENGALFSWEYNMWLPKDRAWNPERFFKKMLKDLSKAGLNLRLKSKKEDSIKYYSYDVTVPGVRGLSVSLVNNYISIEVDPEW